MEDLKTKKEGKILQAFKEQDVLLSEIKTELERLYGKIDPILDKKVSDAKPNDSPEESVNIPLLRIVHDTTNKLTILHQTIIFIADSVAL